MWLPERRRTLTRRAGLNRTSRWCGGFCGAGRDLLTSVGLNPRIARRDGRGRGLIGPARAETSNRTHAALSARSNP